MLAVDRRRVVVVVVVVVVDGGIKPDGLSTRRVPAAEARQGIVIPQGFMGKPGGVVKPSEGWKTEAGSKIENEHKKHKKRGAGQIAVEHSSAKGQFIFVCYINFLLRLLASTVSSFSSSASLRSQPPTSNLYAFHPLKPLTPPDIKGNAN
ncbi:hypothetical protein G5I_03180 [Acromyrmex echinatior]|uniref:Uncharacterized protein n=1 Tax=Acromyrmex echinatior TaxID=103372 RepID=F4WCA6_ACREC|nr:hypothetical protein G5I_03180 [Acromyrmex echinatior]